MSYFRQIQRSEWYQTSIHCSIQWFRTSRLRFIHIRRIDFHGIFGMTVRIVTRGFIHCSVEWCRMVVSDSILLLTGSPDALQHLVQKRCHVGYKLLRMEGSLRTKLFFTEPMWVQRDPGPDFWTSRLLKQCKYILQQSRDIKRPWLC